MHSGDDIVNGH